MRIEKFSFGHITIDGVTYQHDVVIDRGKVQKRVKKPSKKLREGMSRPLLKFLAARVTTTRPDDPLLQ
jgi:hypothetical protein